MRARRFGSGVALLLPLAFGADAHGDDGGKAAQRAKVEAAVKRLRGEAEKAEKASQAARARVDEARANAAAARAKVDVCVAKVDSDEAAWKRQLDRCAAGASSGARPRKFGKSPVATVDPCATLRAQGGGFSSRLEACGKSADLALRSPAEATARAKALEVMARSERARVELAEKFGRSSASAVFDGLVSGRLVAIPAGEFELGATGKTAHVAAFVIERTEVTVAAYGACVKAGQCRTAVAEGDCNARRAGYGNHPVNCVNYFDASAYCTAKGMRLPTEEEWEFAATGGDGRVFPWGDQAPKGQLCWRGTSPRGTCPVGAYPKGRSPFGLDDMAGNVWEWTSSREWGHRVQRGGSWDQEEPERLHSAARYTEARTIASDITGFRCAVSALP